MWLKNFPLKSKPFRKLLLPKPQRGLYKPQPTFQSILSVMFADCTSHPWSRQRYQQSAAWWGQSIGTVENKAKNNHFQIKILNSRRKGGRRSKTLQGRFYLLTSLNQRKKEEKDVSKELGVWQTCFHCQECCQNTNDDAKQMPVTQTQRKLIYTFGMTRAVNDGLIGKICLVIWASRPKNRRNIVLGGK